MISIRLLALVLTAAIETSSAGNASYYGRQFVGRRTAAGDIYNETMFTAAHRTLPFGTYLLVTRLPSGDTCIVRINDRGPFVRSRVIDLSRAAAESIDMIRSGIARVQIEVIDAPPEEIDRLLAMVCRLRGMPPDGNDPVAVRHVALPIGTRGVMEYRDADGTMREREFIIESVTRSAVAEIVHEPGARRTTPVRLRDVEPPPRFPDLRDDHPPEFPGSPESP